MQKRKWKTGMTEVALILDSKQGTVGVCIMVWKKITNVILKCLHGEIMPWRRKVIIPVYLNLQEIYLG